VVVGDKTVCSRLANDGIFLLDTVFQPSIPNLSIQIPPPPSSTPTLIRTLEININDAASLVASLKQIEPDAIAGLDSLVSQLETQLSEKRAKTPPPNDADEDESPESPSLTVENTSWSTVKITDSYFSLLSTLSQCLDEIKRTNLQSVAIPILSLLLDRLYRLDTTLIEKQLATNSSGASASFGY